MATRLYTSLDLAALHYPPLLAENSWSRTEEKRKKKQNRDPPKVGQSDFVGKTPCGENLRRRHSRVAIAIHRRSEKREETRSEKKREEREKREDREEEARSEKSEKSEKREKKKRKKT